MPTHYMTSAYGCAIQSTFPLLSSSTSVPKDTPLCPDIVVRLGEAQDCNETTGNGNSILVGTVPNFGQFIMRDGCEIIVCPESGVELQSLRAIILGSVMSVLLQQRDLLVLHASSVAIANQAVAFLGNSGWGKSTLVSTLHAKGHHFITDDVLPICLASKPPSVIPSYPEIRFLPDTLESLGETLDVVDSDFSSHWKTEKRVTERIAATPVPLLCLFILGVGDRHEIQPIPMQQAFLELAHHSRAMRAIQSLEVKGLRASHFTQCTELVQTVPCFRLKRRPSLEELPQIVALVESHVQNLKESKLH